MPVGIGIFILASLLFVFADNMASIIVFRMFQAAGAASASSKVLAISEDVDNVHSQEKLQPVRLLIAKSIFTTS